MPQGSDLGLNLAAFASRLLEVHETAALPASPRMLSPKFPGTAATVYILEESGGPFWLARAKAGEGVQADPMVPAEAGTLGTVFRDQQALLFEGRTLVQEDYAHLNVRRTIEGLACIPLMHPEKLVGCMEVLSFDDDWEQSRVEELPLFADVAALL